MDTHTFNVPSDWRQNWPLSKLAGCRVEITLDDGDLVDLRAWTDTSATHVLIDTAELESAELSAVIEVYLWAPAARQLGAEAGTAAASWTCDGNSDVAECARVLAMLRDGDPQAFDYLPTTPNLSGEFADDPTPASIMADVVGTGANNYSDDDLGELMDALATAWEDGVSETFGSACEAELIKVCGDEPAPENCPRCGSFDTLHSGHGREGQEQRYCQGCDLHYQIFTMGEE